MPDKSGDGLLGSIVRLNLSVSSVFERIASSAGLTMADYLVLGVIRRSESSRSAPTAIADVLGRTTGGMTLTLDRLVAAGLVLRSPDPMDGRRVVVELTPKGLAAAVQVNAELHAWESELVMPSNDADALKLVEALNAAVNIRLK